MSAAKEYLSSISRLNRMIDLKILERERIWSQCTRITSGMDESKVQSWHDPARGQRAIERLMEIEEEIDNAVDLYADARGKAIKLIDMINDIRYHDVLYHRYIIGAKWQEIAVAMKYDIRWVLRLHGYALHAFQRIMDENGIE